MSLASVSIKNPVFAWMLVFGISFFGLLSFKNIGISQMPDVEFPVLTIDVTWEGAAPEVMESDVVDPIEDAVMGVQSMREVSSVAYQGAATITLEFELNRDIDAALQDVQAKISAAQKFLPKDIDPPIITKTSTEDMPIMFIGISTTRPLRELIEYVEDHIKDRFKSISGVGDIFMGGYVGRNLRVWLNQKKLDQYQLTAKDIVKTIENEHIEVPAGRLETDKKESSIRVMGEARTVEEFENLVISNRSNSPNYRPIKLKEVAKIEDSLDDIRRIVRNNGQRAVGLGIKKQRGTNAVEVGRKVRERMAEVKKDLPKDFDIGLRFDSTKFIKASVHELNKTLVLACILTSIVCWCFLGSVTSTLNIFLAIPVSILGTFMVINFAGFTLNTFTLLALSLGVGLVVDDAIMVLENIVRHREEGESRKDAALNGANQITFAALAATLAIIAIFLPVAYMKGIIGRFFFQYAVTISVAVAFSLLAALTVSPTFCSQVLTIGERTTRFGRMFDRSMIKIRNIYEKWLAVTLQNKKKVLIGSAIFFILSMSLFGCLRKEFVPAQDQSIFMVRVQTPVGSSIQYTDSLFRKVEAVFAAKQEVFSYFSIIGGFSGGQVNTGNMFITLKDPEDRIKDPALKRRLTQQEVMSYLRKELNKIPDVKATMQDLSTRGFAATRGFPIEFTVRGRDWAKLAESSAKIQEEMKKSELFVDVDTDYLEGMPEVRVYVDRDKALERGISVQNITDVVSPMMSGERIGKYTKGGKRYDVRVKVVPEERVSIDDIKKLKTWNNRGEEVTLSDVVIIKQKDTLLSVNRMNRERAISVFANPAPGKSLAKAIAKAEEISRSVLPEGYRVVFSGTSKTFQESFSSLWFALWVGILIAYMVLASQFNHVIHPFTVLLALPFSITGAVLGLVITNQSLNIYSMIGLILLFGIVKKNSILLVEFTNQMRHKGMAPLEALKTACPIRLRPIIMTSVSTIAGAVPAALAMGAGSELIKPMGVAVIGGVVLSTLLTLFVVPAAYLYLVRFEEKETYRGLFGKLKKITKKFVPSILRPVQDKDMGK